MRVGIIPPILREGTFTMKVSATARPWNGTKHRKVNKRHIEKLEKEGLVFSAINRTGWSALSSPATRTFFATHFT